jgi:twitching motility protein PilT
MPEAAPRPLATLEGLNRVLLGIIGLSDKISDIIFSPGKPPQVELNNQLRAARMPGLESLSTDDTADVARVLTERNPVAAESLHQKGSADLSHAIGDKARFRVNVFKQRGTLAAVLRVIPIAIPTFEQLRLPPALREIAELKNGIVLVTGPTGSGKSSTLAAVIDLINESRSDHIVTIEDPVEFSHRHKKSTIHQREVHSDTPSFALALRAALRQAPKVILVGEMRDVETIEIAFEAAETGHLVMSTLHTISAAKTVDRIIGVFPKSEEHIIRARLAATFRFIVSQRLLPRVDGKGRVAALEILKSNGRTQEYIQKGESGGKSLTDAMNDSEIDGMQTFDRVLERLARDGTITIANALAYATNRTNLSLNIHDLMAEQEARV